MSGLALAHGINANLLRKWVKDAKESGSLAVSARSAFMPVACGVDQLAAPEKTAHLPRSSTVSALLPNGVKLSLEYGDVDALTAIIGALGHVQTGR
jgi:transposase